MTGFTIWRLSVEFENGEVDYLAQQKEIMQRRINDLKDLDTDEDPWCNASDVSVDEMKRIAATRHYRETINKNHKDRYQEGGYNLLVKMQGDKT